jgi:hypothetical protein
MPIEAQELLDELHSHDVPFTDADANILVDIGGDKTVARGLPDLQADDPVITGQVAAAFPRYGAQQRADSVRCSPSTSSRRSRRTAAPSRPRARTATERRVPSFTRPGATPIVGCISHKE